MVGKLQAMRILVIGNGAREHALAYSLSQDPSVEEVHVSPGNAGMAAIATLHPAGDAVELASEVQADLVVIGRRFHWLLELQMNCEQPVSRYSAFQASSSD